MKALLLGALLAALAAGAQTPQPASALKTSGTLNALVIFAKFQGEAQGETQAPPWAADLFNLGVPGSFAHFYREMSRGKIQVSGQVLPRRYSSLQPAAAYVAPSAGVQGNFGLFNRQILVQADRDADLGRFDNDGPDGLPNSGDDDGYVDVVFINLLTVPRNFFISGATGYASLGLDTDFISNDPAAKGGTIHIRSRFSGFGGTTQRGHTFSVTAASMCHEFGHVLGLPDLFDQSSVTASGQLDPTEESAGVGKWCLMTSAGTQGWGVEDGPNAFCAWALAKLGWVEVVELTQDQPDLAIEDVAIGNKIYKIRLSADECFLLENRRRASSYYNRSIPGEGLLVWHVDERADNDEERHPQVDLVCADGLYADKGYPDGQPDTVRGRDNLDFWAKDEAYTAAHHGNEGDATDPFDGQRFTRLAWDTNPSLSAHTGFSRNLPLGMALENIRREGTRMRCDVRLHQKLPGHISTDTTWSGTVQLDGDVVVDPGVKLILAEGTRIRFAAADSRRTGFDAGRCELIVYGGLQVQGQIRCESAATVPRADDWLGLFLMDGQPLDTDQLQLVNARYGLVRSRLPAGITHFSGVQSLFQDLIIPVGAELVVDSNAQLQFAPADLSGSGLSPALSELVVEGKLSAEGGTFTVAQTSNQDLWFGVRLAPGAQVKVHDATIERCGYGFSGEVSATSSFALEGGRIQQGLAGLSLTLNGPAQVTGTTFFHLTTPAIYVQGGGLLSLRDVTVQQCGQEGISLGNASLEAVNLRLEQNGLLDPKDPRSGLKAVGGRGQKIELWNSSSTRNTQHGLDLEAWEGVVEIHDSQLSANQHEGLRARGLERLTFEQVQVERNLGDGAVVAAVPIVEVGTTNFADNIGTGLVLREGASGAIEMSHFLNNAGLRLENIPKFTVRTSTFSNAGVGFESQASSPQVEGNTFEHNLTALKVSGTQVPTLTRNTFLDNRIAVENLSDQILPAQGNYWGTTDSITIAALFKGQVAWQPFLDAAPEQTPVEEGDVSLPKHLVLHPGFPNPFNARTTFPFELPREGRAALTIYDPLGRPLRRLLDTSLPAGMYTYGWDGRDEQGREVASGVYFCRLQAGNFGAVQRLALVR